MNTLTIIGILVLVALVVIRQRTTPIKQTDDFESVIKRGLKSGSVKIGM